MDRYLKIIADSRGLCSRLPQTVEKPLMGFSDKFLQSAARTPCSPMANNSHTCSLRCIFCQVHAPTENDLILFGGLRRQTLRGFFDKLR